MKSRVIAVAAALVLGLAGCSSEPQGRSTSQEIPTVSIDEPVSTPYGPVSLVAVSDYDGQYFDDNGKQVERDEYLLTLNLLNRSGETLSNICNGDPLWVSEEDEGGQDASGRPTTKMACVPVAEPDQSYQWTAVVPATGKEQRIYLMATDEESGKTVTEGVFVFGPGDVTVAP